METNIHDKIHNGDPRRSQEPKNSWRSKPQISEFKSLWHTAVASKKTQLNESVEILINSKSVRSQPKFKLQLNS